MIEVVDLHKRWDDQEVLRGVSLCLKSGEHTALCGPSGSGKSTLLNLMARLCEPDAGALSFDGTPYAECGTPQDFRLSRLGLVFQEVDLLESLSVAQNLEMIRLAAGGRGPRVDELLEPLGLEGRRDDRVSVLSRGERQRVALARAFANGPRFLLADEPTASLDPSNRDRTLEFMFSLCQQTGTTALVVSHDLEVFERSEFRQRYSLQGGRIVDLSTT
ncbi:MAG: ATP-binding cassette domain-containing protein [Myxococcota bacterium]|nr:ATP-binding cassette domain-containing protein [Myxococcota bacterium]